MLFPTKNRGNRVPRRVVDYPEIRATREAIYFSWQRDSIARIYVVAGQLSIMHNNPDIPGHAQFWGEQRGSIAWILMDHLQNHNHLTYEKIKETCIVYAPRERVYFRAIVHKFYERIHKVGVQIDIGQVGKNEHYSKWKTPASTKEIEQASNMIVRL